MREAQDEPDGTQEQEQEQERERPAPVVPWSAARDRWVAEQAVEQERWRQQRAAEARERRAELDAEESEAAAVQRAQAWVEDLRSRMPSVTPTLPTRARREDPPLLDPPPGWTPQPDQDPDDTRARAAQLPGQRWARTRWGRPARGSGYARPALLLGAPGTGKSRSAAAQVRAHEGSVVVVSTKTDLLDWTVAARRARGPVHVLDPAGVTGRRHPASGFDLMRHARDLDAAGALVHALAAWRPGGSDDKDFWMPLGAAVNQAVAFACARTGQGVAEWHRLVLEDDGRGVAALLRRADSDLARSLWKSYVEREERNRSSVILTARQQVRVLDSPAAQRMLSRDDVDPTRLLPDGPVAGDPTTLYLTVPSDKVEVFGSLVPLVVDLVMGAALERESVHGPATPPLLVVLDEVAALGLSRLPRWVDLCRSAGVQLLVLAQSLSTLATAFGAASCEQVLGSSDLLCLGGGRDPRTAALLAATTGGGVRGLRARGGTELQRGFSLLRALPRRGPGSALLLTDSAAPQLVRLDA